MSANDKKIVNDEIISKADELEPRAQTHWLKGTNFFFETVIFFSKILHSLTIIQIFILK